MVDTYSANFSKSTINMFIILTEHSEYNGTYNNNNIIKLHCRMYANKVSEWYNGCFNMNSGDCIVNDR